MTLTKIQLWDRFRKTYSFYPTIRLGLDVSRMNCPDDYIDMLQPRWREAFDAMKALEAGAESNPDEHRMVGHYWLRNPSLAPNPDLRGAIQTMNREVQDFATEVHAGRIRGSNVPFKDLLVIGIGGSALGPQFIAGALGKPGLDLMRPAFLDNTDPDGIDRVLARLDGRLDQTLTVVISKSGDTKETSNGMLEVKEAYQKAGLDFARHAVAVTGAGSRLDNIAKSEGWIRRFPMWDWVGGRTSVTSAVGLLPAALQGINTQELLNGASECDEITRVPKVNGNPAALLATMWHYVGGGQGTKDMVIIPYKDRLELFSRYLQQLVMESLGKETVFDGKSIHQGLAVYGNKGSTDQHAYIQQLRDGLNNFFVTFIRVLKDRQTPPFMVEPEVTSGDYLDGFLLGTREALFQKGRESITITVDEVSPFTVGVLIAMYERAVGFYASLIGINAYHQPGVQAGKLAARDLLDLQAAILKTLPTLPAGQTADAIATAIKAKDDVESVFHILEHLSANPARGIKKSPGTGLFDARYSRS